jgi:hypothetical protein
MLLIGSFALSKNSPYLKISSKDRDFIVDEKTFIDVKNKVSKDGFKILINDDDLFAYKDSNEIIIELTLAKIGDTNYELLEQYNAFDSKIKVANNITLLWLKESHKYKKDSPHFYKTMNDIQTLRILVGDNYKETKPSWFKKREVETYNYSHPSLNTTKKEFFDDSVPYIYDHDDIHNHVAISNEPAYKSFSSGEVNCSKDMFNSLPYEKKLNSVVEESMVLSLERSLIPNEFKTDPVKFYLYALMKVCTSITSGWWREFAWENHFQAIEKFNKLRNSDFIYENKIKSAISNQNLKLHIS